MSTLDWSLQQAGGDTAYHTANAAVIPLLKQIVWNTQTGQYKIGDGVTALSALTYYPTASTETFTITCAHGPTVQFTSGATLYWTNWIFAASSLRSTAGQTLTTIPVNATLVKAVITTWNAASSTSQTASTVNFRLAGVDNVISSAVLWSASAATPVQHVVTGLNIPVTSGQTWEIKLVMGALATPPTSSAQCTVVLYFQV